MMAAGPGWENSALPGAAEALETPGKAGASKRPEADGKPGTPGKPGIPGRPGIPVLRSDGSPGPATVDPKDPAGPGIIDPPGCPGIINPPGWLNRSETSEGTAAPKLPAGRGLWGEAVPWTGLLDEELPRPKIRVQVAATATARIGAPPLCVAGILLADMGRTFR